MDILLGHSEVVYEVNGEVHRSTKQDRCMMFPFDAQPLKIEMQLGRDKASGAQLLFRDGWRLAHHPTEPNIMVNQVEAGYTFRPLRYSISLTGELESRARLCKCKFFCRRN